MSKNIVVVGGGTAGWSCAALLSAYENFNITVIEPSDIPTIGVGESTIPFMNVIHDRMNLEIFETPKWLEEVNGTLKFSIEFAEFDGPNHKWDHPFIACSSLDTDKTHKLLRNQIDIGSYRNQTSLAIDNYVLPGIKARRFVESWEQSFNPYLRDVGYHIDASLYGNLLKRESIKRENCSFIDSSVSDISLDKDGGIDHLTLKNGKNVYADLFIDCTGFKGILAESVGSEWENPYEDRLFVDTAMAVQLPYLNEDLQKRNTTYCHALGSGWVWNVPLENRIGTGYVFSRRHITADEAKEELIDHLSTRYGYDPNNINPREVKFNVGRRSESWKKNVVSIGLSSFFLEPIESTAIAHLQHQADVVGSLLNSDHISMDRKIKRFNYLNNIGLDAIACYIELHYILSERRDTKFWRDFTSLKLTDVQKRILMNYSSPDDIFNTKKIEGFFDGHSIFDVHSHTFLFLGFGMAPNLYDEKVKTFCE